MTQISVGNASNVWGVNVAGQVFQWQGSSLGWQQISGVNSLKQVAVGCDGTVRGLDADNAFVSWNGSQWDYATGSINNPSIFKQLSVGDANTLWAVDNNSTVFKLDTSASVWRQVPGNLSDVSAASDNTAVWGIEANDVIVQGNQAASPAVVPKPTAVMRYTKSLNFLDGNDTAVNIEQIVSPSFTHLSGYLSDSFGRSAAFGVDKQGNVFRYSNNDWQQVLGNMEQLSVGEYTRTIWALDASGTPYSSTYDGDSWIPTNNNSLGETNVSFTQIASGRITNGLDAQGSVWSWDSGRFWVNEFITAKSIAPTVTDRVLWGINNNDEVFRYERFSRQTVTYPWSFNGKPKQIVEVELQGVGDYLVVLDSSGDLYYGSPYLGIGLGEMWVKIGSHVKQIGGAYIDGEVLHVSALTELNTPPSQRIDLIGLDVTGDGNYERVLKITDQAGDSALVYQPMAILYIMKLFGIPVTQADIERFSPAQRQALAAQTEIAGLSVDDNGNIQSLELALLNNSLDALESLEVQTGLSGSTWTEERINSTTFGQPTTIQRQSGSVETFTIEVNSGSTTSTTEVTFLGYENEQRTLGTEGLPIGRNQEAYLVKAENTTTVNDTNVGATVIVGGTNNKAYVNDKSMAANKSVTLVGAEGNVGSKESTHVVAGVGVGEGAGIAASWGEGGLYGGEIEIWFFKVGFYITDDDANMVYNDSKNWLEGAANDTADWGEQAWQDTSAWFASTADTAGDATMQFIDSAENWTVNAVNDGRDVTMNVVDGAESVTLKISNATSTVVNDVSNGVDTAIQTGGSVVSAVSNEINNIGNAIQSTANTVGGGIVDLGRTIRDGFCGIFGC